MSKFHAKNNQLGLRENRKWNCG